MGEVEDVDFEQEPSEVDLVDHEVAVGFFGEQSRLELGGELLCDLDVVLDNDSTLQAGEDVLGRTCFPHVGVDFNDF